MTKILSNCFSIHSRDAWIESVFNIILINNRCAQGRNRLSKGNIFSVNLNLKYSQLYDLVNNNEYIRKTVKIWNKSIFKLNKFEHCSIKTFSICIETEHLIFVRFRSGEISRKNKQFNKIEIYLRRAKYPTIETVINNFIILTLFDF
jgi:hypothetical protein